MEEAKGGFPSLLDMLILTAAEQQDSDQTSHTSLIWNSAYLLQVLTVFQTDLAQDVFHCFTRLSDLLDVSNRKLIHYSSQSL